MNSNNWQPLSFAQARRDQLPQPDFCLPNLIAGTVGVVAAPAGIGKTSLLMQIAASAKSIAKSIGSKINRVRLD